MTEQSNIEKVKEMLDESVTCEDGSSHFIDESNKRYLSSEICQRFPKTQDNPDGYEPKPDDKDSVAITQAYFRGRAAGLMIGKIQARQEMVEEIEGHWELVAEENHLPYFRFDYGRWQELKRGVK